MKKIGILTSGGDCPGLNAVIRSVVKCASHKGWEVYGIPYGTDGFIGLVEGQYRLEDLRLKEHGYDIPGLLQGLDVLQFLSGSVLGSLSKGDPNQPEVASKVLEGYRQLGLDALIAVGGDGSLEIIYNLAQKGGWKMIAIPKTIDNDVPFTERAVGFDTAINTVTNALYDLTFTAASHDRVMVVQVMGRDAGHLGLFSGIAAGADVILIPELAPTLSIEVVDQVCRHIARMRQEHRKFALVVIAEGVKDQQGQKHKHIAEYLSRRIQEHSAILCQSGQQAFCEMDEIDTRSTVLGHIQRSGSPSSNDRLLAIAFGKMAVDLIERECYDQLVVWQAGRVEAYPLEQVVPMIQDCHREDRCARPVKADDLMVQVAQSLGIYLGNIAPQSGQSNTPEKNGDRTASDTTLLQVSTV